MVFGFLVLWVTFYELRLFVRLGILVRVLEVFCETFEEEVANVEDATLLLLLQCLSKSQKGMEQWEKETRGNTHQGRSIRSSLCSRLLLSIRFVLHLRLHSQDPHLVA